MNPMASIWHENILEYLSWDIICSSKLATLSENCSLLRADKSADKYPSIFPG